MQYTSFTIHEYRGITQPIHIDLTKSPIIPLIGVNECGKTTILQAIFALDEHNDKLGTQLRDVQNLYSFKEGDPRVSACIQASQEALWEALSYRLSSRQADVKDLVDSLDAEFETSLVKRLQAIRLSSDPPKEESNDVDDQGTENDNFVLDATNDLAIYVEIARTIASMPSTQFDLKITRHLKSNNYKCYFNDKEIIHGHELASMALKMTDYIHYFDDFRYEVPSSINLSTDATWKGIVEELIQQSDKDLDLDTVFKLDERRRKSAISKVEKHLNETLTKVWQQFHLEERDALEIHIDLDPQQKILRFEVAEKTLEGQDVYFDIKDRSKGFYWFFNFVMRLEFNSRAMSQSKTVYLLDEPGSYLHARAQESLCQKLRTLSVGNVVIYCTHSHHLLAPQTIPVNAIRIVERNSEGSISLYSIAEHPNDNINRHSAFQPILEALQVRPSAFDIRNSKVIVTEGLYDFFLFDIMKPDENYQIIPAVGADSVRYHISLLMAWRIPFFALWDNDGEGRKKHAEATKFFGIEEAKRRFRLLPTKAPQRKRILQDLISNDLAMLRAELSLSNSSFKKVVMNWYYSELRDSIKRKLSQSTIANFAEIFALFESPSAK